MGVNLNIPQQTHQPLLAGASSPQQSAAIKLNEMNQKQTAMNSLGGKRKKRGGATIEVPPTSTASYNVNGGVKNVMTSNVLSQTNAEYDKGAFAKGGRKSKRHRTRHNSKKKTKKTRRHKSRRYRRH